jgi:hypothetical protein
VEQRRGTLRLGLLLLRAAGLLLVGLLTSIAVAWGLAAWLPNRDWEVDLRLVFHEDRFDLRPVDWTQAARVGMTRRDWFVHRYGAFNRNSLLGRSVEPAQRRAQTVDMMWGRLPAALRFEEGARASGIEDARGWPLLCLWCEFSYTGGAAAQPHRELRCSGGIMLSDHDADAADVRGLPLRPIVAGLWSIRCSMPRCGRWWSGLYGGGRCGGGIGGRAGSVGAAGTTCAGLQVGGVRSVETNPHSSARFSCLRCKPGA